MKNMDFVDWTVALAIAGWILWQIIYVCLYM